MADGAVYIVHMYMKGEYGSRFISSHLIQLLHFRFSFRLVSSIRPDAFIVFLDGIYFIIICSKDLKLSYTKKASNGLKISFNDKVMAPIEQHRRTILLEDDQEQNLVTKATPAGKETPVKNRFRREQRVKKDTVFEEPASISTTGYLTRRFTESKFLVSPSSKNPLSVR
jgi:hypothetical protein